MFINLSVFLLYASSKKERLAIYPYPLVSYGKLMFCVKSFGFWGVS